MDEAIELHARELYEGCPKRNIPVSMARVTTGRPFDQLGPVSRQYWLDKAAMRLKQSYVLTVG